MRKFIFSSSLISAVFSGWSVLQSTLHGPRDWRQILMWVNWGIAIAIAAGTVVREARTGIDDPND